jgi:ABC-type sugar transport system ATPase subunit
MAPLVLMNGVSKHFAGIQALGSASLTLEAGSVLALMGANGAGKSTLIKVLSGAIVQDSGDVVIDGTTVAFRTPLDAQEAGVSTVYQELSLFTDLSVAENLSLGAYPTKGGLISWRRTRRQADDLLGRLDMPVRSNALVRDLSLADRCLVEIAKAVRDAPKILILDEPTAALDPADSEHVFNLVETLRKQGTGIIFVSHRLDEVMRISQTFMTLRNGTTVAQGLIADVTQDALVDQMLGRGGEPATTVVPELIGGLLVEVGPVDGEQPAISVRGLCTRAIKDVSFEARPGRIVGIAGLRGSGQSQLCRTLVGADPIVAGEIVLKGRRYSPRSPQQAWRRGVGYLPAERKSEGLFLNLSVAKNMMLSRLAKDKVRWITARKERSLAESYRTALDIRIPASDVSTVVSHLSGGNQQKVVLGRCLAANLNVMILDEPTRGVDVGAKEQIHALIRELAADGMCVIVSSSEIDELLSLSHDVIVMHRGAMTGFLSADEADEHTILALASGISHDYDAPSGDRNVTSTKGSGAS